MKSEHPTIIQGGMGAAVSGWQLARAVSLAGELGVVSGTALDVVLARRLQLGDPDGHLRRALEAFPYPQIAHRVLKRYFISGGKSPDAPFATVPILGIGLRRSQLELLVVANFVEVYLAREGHTGRVGINYLEKIQLPTLASLFGAMLARVDYVLVGAGIPLAIPRVLDRLSAGQPVELPVTVSGDGSVATRSRFDPLQFTDGEPTKMDRPLFLAIVASSTLATMLAKKASGKVDGFVVEGPTAGGHNAPPRGKPQLNDRGEPLYGRRDAVDLQTFRDLRVPFWLAGSYGSPERLAEARQAGAAGIQVGTAFAFCQESGLHEEIQRRVVQLAKKGECAVFTDPLASPTGFPFKVLQLAGTLSSSDHGDRQRRCDLGFLRQAYKREDGSIGWRCPAEPVDAYVSKGGFQEQTDGRKCLCNALLSNVGLGQVRSGVSELPLVTCGDDVKEIHRFLPHPQETSYRAKDVISRLLSPAMVHIDAST